MLPAMLLLTFLCLRTGLAFNGELAELECPDECDCHYFRVNWVTDCSNSNLTRVPYEELSTNLYVLDLNDNLISDLDPFPSEIKMRRLQMAHNAMTELRKSSFKGLNFLIDADFSGNKIRRVDPDAFDDSPGIITLELQNNPLDPVEGPFLSLSSLMYLDISNCSLAFLNDHFFDNISALSTLDLSENPLEAINTKAFDPLTSLETLKLNHCGLKSISHDAFTSLKNLKSLELSGNSFDKINWDIILGKTHLLEYLDLRNSQLTELSPTMFDNNPYMRSIILAENNLSGSDVEHAIKNLTNLESLDLSSCNLSRPFSEETFINTTKIRSLSLSGNTLFASDLLVALAPLINLQKLSLSNCGLSRLPDTFDKFKSLQELDISHNPLNDAFVKLLAPLNTLEYLNMGYSNLSHLAPVSFTKMTNMRRLILSGNDLDNLEPGLFGNLTKLESLELNFCGLRRPLNATLFFNNFTYTDLKELQLAGNPLRVSKTGPLLPKQLSRLEVLDLSNCNLTFLSPEAFYHTRNITHLILAGNHFSSPNDLRFLELLPKLSLLDLRYNNLTTFSPNDISLNINVEKLKLIGNPWKCDCAVAELWDWAHLEKGDLDVLEGSKLGAEDVTVGKTKRKKLLVCNYDTEKQPLPIVMNKTVAGRRPFLKPQRMVSTSNRTWAKYVRESGCEQNPQLRRSPRAAQGYVSKEGVNMKYAEHVPNTWASAAINSCLVYVSFITILGLVYILNRKRRVIRTVDKNN